MTDYNHTSLSNANISTGDGNDTVTVSNSSGSNGLSSSTLNTGNGNDSVVITSYGYALSSSTINLGDGNDFLNANSTYSSNDYSNSTVDAGSGDDTVYAYIPSNSTFIGGSGKDTIIFSGNRSTWDLEFVYTSAGSLDYILTSNSNKLYGWEVYVFDDVSLDLTSAPLDATGLSKLEGNAPQLSSTVTPDLWDGLGFNRLTLNSLSNANVSTGDGNDTVTVSNSSGSNGLSSSTLNTGNGNDSVVITSYGYALSSSTINLGDGNDFLNANSTYSSNDYSNSTVDAGSGDDTVYAYIPSNSTFIGGSGKDTIVFSGLTNNWSINTKAKDNLGRSYIAIGANKVYGFETIRFEQADPSGKLVQTLNGGKDAVDALGPWRGKSIIQGDSINEQPMSLNASSAGNQLIGSSFADNLAGRADNDIIIGMRGTDTMSGNGGADLFVLGLQDWFENDRITDFQPNTDKILLENLGQIPSLFASLSNKKTAAKTLATVKTDNAALIAKTILVYSQATGNLYYNPNRDSLGLGVGGGIIAILNTGLKLTGLDVVAGNGEFV